MIPVKEFNRIFLVLSQSIDTGPDKEEIFTPTVFFRGSLENLTGSRRILDDSLNPIINRRIYCKYNLGVKAQDLIVQIDKHTIAVADVGKYHKLYIDSNFVLTTGSDVGKTVLAYNADDTNGTNMEYDQDNEFVIDNIDNPMYLNDHLELECLQKEKVK